MLQKLPVWLLVFLCCAVAGCKTNETATNSTDWQPFQGEVVWVKRNRGFWAIEAERLGKISPMKIPEEFKVNGLKISGEVRLFPEAESARNWGTVCEVRALKKQ